LLGRKGRIGAVNLITRALALFLAAALGGCAALPDPAGPVAGRGVVRVRLVAAGQTVDGAVIHALREPGVRFQEKVFQAQAGPDGFAELLLPTGPSYLTARSPGGGIFGYYGPNPVQVRSGEVQSFTIQGLAGNSPPLPSLSEEGRSSVSGEVVTEGGPLGGAVAAFYLDAVTRFRGPAYLEVPTDGEGRFETSLSAGRYFLVVRKREEGGSPFGPLKVGDHFGYYAFNPFFVGSGERVRLRVGAVEVLRRTGWEEPSAIRTRLSGGVRDESGRPLAGYRAFLHSRPEMLGKADFVSEPTAADGSWDLWVGREGTFYLGARKEVGRARSEGEIVGRYGGTPDHSIVVRMDGREMTGLDVIVQDEEQ
jgi:hypothetical protein